MKLAQVLPLATWFSSTMAMAINRTSSDGIHISVPYNNTHTTDLAGRDDDPAHHTHQPNTFYNCNLNTLCGGPGMAASCDKAVNEHIYRGDPTALYGPGTWPGKAHGAPKPCYGNFFNIGCHVWVTGGEQCLRSGDEIWWDYQDIKNDGGCWSCGEKTWGPIQYGCMTHVDYITDCVWH